MKNNSDLLYQLHGLVLNDLIDKIQSGEATSADLSTAIKFLKDNNVVLDLSAPQKEINKKVTQIPRLNVADLHLA
jgi:hypothetical protein